MGNLHPEGLANDGHHGTALFSAGLGLFGFRAIPVVGRESERDRLWDVLRDVRTRRQAKVLILPGRRRFRENLLPSGCVVRRMNAALRWRCEQRTSLFLGSMMACRALSLRHYRPQGLFGQALVSHLEKVLTEGEVKEWEWLALAELIAPSPNATLVIFLRRQQSAMRWCSCTLARVGVERPLVVFADNAHWGVESLELAAHILEVFQVDTPLLFVLSVTDAIIASRPREAEALLAELEQLDGVQRLSLEGLDPASMSLLIREMLQLGGDLPDRLQQHGRGTPAMRSSWSAIWYVKGS